MTRSLYDHSKEDFVLLLHDQPQYRVDQLWTGLYEHSLEVKDISNLPLSLRKKIADNTPTSLTEAQRFVADNGDTVKFLWHLVNGNHPIETVLMYYEDRATVCVSTQAGCAMACGFCATGQAGFTRHLTAGEIIEQVVRCAREASVHDRRIDNIVFMGMGEPLANLDPVSMSIERIHDDIGISARHITVSTVGIIPGIRAMGDWELPVNLAVSLHAARNDLRDELVPINKRYPIEDLIDACTTYLEKKNRRVTFEWALIDSVNDTDRDARELAQLCKKLYPSAHVNLIPLNPTPGWPTKGSSASRVREFRELLVSLGVNATVRNNRGTDIAAACGQLAAGQPIQLRTQRNTTSA